MDSNRETLKANLHQELTSKGFLLRETTDGLKDIKKIYVGTVDGISADDFEGKVVPAVEEICRAFNWHLFVRHFPWGDHQYGMFSVVYDVPFSGVGRIGNGK